MRYERNTNIASINFTLDGMGFITFLVFLILKVTGTWPEITWFWVFFPLWIGFAVGFVLFLLLILIAIILSKLE